MGQIDQHYQSRGFRQVVVNVIKWEPRLISEHTAKENTLKATYIYVYMHVYTHIYCQQSGICQHIFIPLYTYNEAASPSPS